MAPRGRGRGRGRDRTSTQGPGTKPNNPVKFMTALENMASAMQATAESLGQQINNNGNGKSGAQGPMTLATFLKFNPPMFKGTNNTTKVDTWFHVTKQALQAQMVPEEKCDEFATYLLTGKHRIDGKESDVSCNRLKQGAMSVSEYTDKFEELFRFSHMCQGAPRDFKEWKCIKYEGGLWSDIFSSVGPMEIRTFSELVNKSKVTEEYVKKAAAERGSHMEPFLQN
ncbi:uncharacterized protein LOC107473859 [Arachis duranensis]|uniref:Uncharacterized protein LOC107473859 n=1 Tax=Arachis duranensis TaxID=130453 RepID=A0A6P4CCL7_ARADU|nr:uncharacterized protein LOC107473859 [Arachis duranensis]